MCYEYYATVEMNSTSHPGPAPAPAPALLVRYN